MTLVPLNGGVSQIAVRGSRITVGRSADCDVVVDDPRISKRHAILTRVDDRLYVTDQSLNGTFIDRAMIQRGLPTRLRPGQELSLVYCRSRHRLFQPDALSYVLHLSATLPPIVIAHLSRVDIMREYTFTQSLGTGNFASVYLATHQPTGNVHALKVINKRHYMRLGGRQSSMLDEVRAMERLSHHNIVRIFSCFENEEFIVIVME